MRAFICDVCGARHDSALDFGSVRITVARLDHKAVQEQGTNRSRTIELCPVCFKRIRTSDNDAAAESIRAIFMREFAP